MPALGAALADFIVCGEDAVHRALAAEVDILVEKGRVDFCGRDVRESVLVEHVEDGSPLFGQERARPRRNSSVKTSDSQNVVTGLVEAHFQR